MARWRGQPAEPEVPAWVRHASDGGFIASDWAEPDDFGLDPRLAVSRAEARWVKARCDWLNDHLDVADILLEQLRERARRIP